MFVRLKGLAMMVVVVVVLVGVLRAVMSVNVVLLMLVGLGRIALEGLMSLKVLCVMLVSLKRLVIVVVGVGVPAIVNVLLVMFSSSTREVVEVTVTVEVVAAPVVVVSVLLVMFMVINEEAMIVVVDEVKVWLETLVTLMWVVLLAVVVEAWLATLVTLPLVVLVEADEVIVVVVMVMEDLQLLHSTGHSACTTWPIALALHSPFNVAHASPSRNPLQIKLWRSVALVEMVAFVKLVTLMMVLAISPTV